MAEYVEVIDIDAGTVIVSNSINSATLYSFSIPGNSLEESNTLRFQGQAFTSLLSSATLSIFMSYGGNTVSTVLLSATSQQVSKPLLIEGWLSASGGPTLQVGTLRVTPGFTLSVINQTKLASYGSSSTSSNGEADFKIIAKWSTASASNALTFRHGSLEKTGYIESTLPPELTEPNFMLLAGTLLNKLHWETRKDITFYAPLEYDLAFLGIGDSTFTRSIASSALWRDGSTHSIDVNKPRFEYLNDITRGMSIDTTTEVLMFGVNNGLHNSNTLVWIEDFLVKSTLTASNPFNSSGVYIGASGVSIKHIIKFNKVVTPSVVAAIGLLFAATVDDTSTPTISFFGRLAVPAGTIEINIPHNIGTASVVDGNTTWNTDFYIINDQPNFVTVRFTDPPSSSGFLHWGAT
jgi:hypothetical protein